jgi:hypothetical protein
MTAMDIYREAKAAMTGYVRGLDGDTLGVTCAACPDWSIKDTLAHHIHAQRSLVDSTFPPDAMTAITSADPDERAEAGDVRDRWSAAGVRARSDRTVDELLDEWDHVEESLANSEAIVLVADLTVHFDDIRETVEGPVARVGVDIPHTLGRYHHFQTIRYRAMDAPSVDLECVDTGERLGDGSSAVVRGDSYDLVRCLVGRRRRAEADEVLDWGDTTEETKKHFATYGWND